MVISYKKLPGLDEEKILGIVEPVLATHRVDGVELIWKGDRGGQVLELTLEKPDCQRSGEGITIELCSEISRQISAELDEQEVISAKYRLEVGSPGVERALYSQGDFKRFAGHLVKIKTIEAVSEPSHAGKKTVVGNLFGMEGESHVLVETDEGQLSVPRENIASARLVFEWGKKAKPTGRKPRPHASGSAPQRTKRSNQNGRR